MGETCVILSRPSSSFGTQTARKRKEGFLLNHIVFQGQEIHSKAVPFVLR